MKPATESKSITEKKYCEQELFLLRLNYMFRTREKNNKVQTYTNIFENKVFLNIIKIISFRVKTFNWLIYTYI